MLRRSSLAFRLVVLVVIGVAIVLGVFSISAVLAVQDSIDRTLQGRLVLARTLAEQVDYVLDRDMGRLQSLSFAEGFDLSDGDPEPEQRALRDVYFQTIFSGGLYIVDRQGRILNMEPPVADANGASADGGASYVGQVLSSGKPLVTNVHTSSTSATRGPVVSAIMPIWDAKGEIAGALGGDIDLTGSGLREIIRTAGLGATGYAQLVDAKGTVLASTVPEYLLTESDHGQTLSTLIAEKKSTTGRCHDCHQPTASKPERTEVMAFAPLPSVAWGVVVRESEDEALAPSNNLRRQFLLFGAGVLGVGILLAWATAQSLSRPLRTLTTSAQEIASGNLSERVQAQGEDEVGKLAQALEIMRVRLRESLERLQNWSRELEQSVQERTQKLEAALEQNASLVAELQRKEAVRSELLRRVIAAQEDERRRIARELHDDTSQALTVLAMSLERTAASVESPEERGKLEKMKGLALGMLDDVHKLIFDLRPSLLDDLGLVAAARWYAESRLVPQGIRVSLETVGEERRLPPEVETALFRAIQETLTNVARHAEAENVAMTLEFDTNRVLVEVEDDGRGFDVGAVRLESDQARGLGLLGMQERVSLLGGTIDIHSEPGSGTTVHMEVPVPRARESHA
jgi:signal transduction histidine kinase